MCTLKKNIKLACGYFCTDINIDISILVCMAVFHLSKPVSDSILKSVSVCMCKCCGRLGFGAVALATRVTTFLLPLNVLAKTFTLYSHMCLIMFYMQTYRQNNIYNNLLIEKCTFIHYWTSPSWFHSLNHLKPVRKVLVLQME